MIKIINNDCLLAMKEMEDNSIDFIVTDPPYGLHFMGKTWDKFKKSNFNESGNHKDMGDRSRRATYCANAVAGTYDERRNDEFQEFMYNFGIEALRILKPGGHIAMWGAPRRFHRQTCGLEDAGFEIRDCLMWLFGQGFPKSHNNFGLEGYGTALKPAWEPIILAMKPPEGTYKQNAEKWGVGGLNIDESRISTDDSLGRVNNSTSTFNYKNTTPLVNNSEGKGRWPSNLILDSESAAQLDQQTGDLKSGGSRADGPNNSEKSWKNTSKEIKSFNQVKPSSGGASRFFKVIEDEPQSRFFYCPKASSSERNAGLEGMPLKESGAYGGFEGDERGRQTEHQPKANNHPTVKPLSLMRYIIKLLAPPGDPMLLDPFMGSGSTLCAAKQLGIRAIGIELDSEYCEISRRRIEGTKQEEKQMELFDNL